MKAMALLIGGIVPAVLLGLGTVLMRLSVGAGASVPAYLTLVGTTVALIGGSSWLLGGQPLPSPRAIAFAIGMGASWSTAISCMAHGFATFRLPVSIVAPLSNGNALVAVLLGAFLLGEWKSLYLPQVLAGTVLIGAGATLVSLAR